MEKQVKEKIVEELVFQSSLTSQNRLAQRLGISPATLSSMMNGKWKLIHASMWRKAMINLRIDLNWNISRDTTNFKILLNALDFAQGKSLSMGISENAGIGKSQVFKQFHRTRKNVIYVECSNYWSKKTFAKMLCISAGLDDTGTTEQLIVRFIDHLKVLENPIVIFDQADKLKDPQLDLFMDFYNELHGYCAFVLSGVRALKKRILRGVQHDKPGYREMWSRMGRKFFEGLKPLSLQDVASVCMVNGVEDRGDIKMIHDISEGDLRTVRREVEKVKALAA